ncbi:MAG: DsbA family protein [Candidatus Sungbacteria bacterium]|nr:DsbA family protein [Candidatus Sungbacteria bacterium]
MDDIRAEASRFEIIERREKNRRFKCAAMWLSAAVFVSGAVAGTFWLAKNEGPAVTASISEAVSEKDWSRGSPDARAVLVEYSDFQCPACAAYYPMAEELQKEFGDKLRFVYRHFPLRQHAYANLTARATEAAGRQGKFWEMYGIIFEHQKEWAASDQASELMAEYAKTLNLDMDKFSKDLASDEVKERVENNLQSGLSSRVEGTPTFFLNGSKIQNPRNYAEFKQLITETLAGGS